MSTPPLSVGDLIESRCTTCRRITNHIIIAMVGKRPDKVLCNTCQGKHSYRSPDAVKKPAQRAGGAAGLEPPAWSDLLSGSKRESATDYSMDGEYRVGAVVRHLRFGLGVVQRVAGNRKIEVLFEDGKKTMRCK